MQEFTVIDNPAASAVSLDPVRARLLAELAEPGSATTLAERVGLPRQRVQLPPAHARAARAGRGTPQGNMIERVLRATAASYVNSPAALSNVAPDPGRAPDQLSDSSHCGHSTGIRHFWGSELLSAPEDPGQDVRHIDSIWPMLDLTPSGRGTDPNYPKPAYLDSP